MKPPRHRWFQFGLSALLIATAVTAVLVAWQRERLSRWVDSLLRAPPAATSDARDPKQVVGDFLRHSRGGNRREADKLLSHKARETTREYQNFYYGVPAGVHVEDEETLDDGTCRVDCIARASASEVLELRWILRAQAEGWRITGFIVLERGAMQPIRTNLEDAESVHELMARLAEKWEP